MKISVIGAGYVGMGCALTWASKHDVVFFDTDPKRVRLLNESKSPIAFGGVEEFFAKNHKRIHATDDLKEALLDTTYCFICIPTPLNEQTNRLDVSAIYGLLGNIEKIAKTQKVPQIFIRSTLNIEDADAFANEFGSLDIVVMPEFLREAHLVEDVLHPSRIVLGHPSKKHLKAFLADYLENLQDCPEAMAVSYKEAIMIKLFSNSYLALRVAFFNELDSLASSYGVSSEKVIHGLGLDPRIGDYYNQPSEGFGGKCLPKDITAASQAIEDAAFGGCLLKAAILSNEVRKKNSK